MDDKLCVVLCAENCKEEEEEEEERRFTRKHGKIGNAWIAFSAMHLGWVSIQSFGPHLNDWKNLSFSFLFFM